MMVDTIPVKTHESITSLVQDTVKLVRSLGFGHQPEQNKNDKKVVKNLEEVPALLFDCECWE